MSRAKLFLVIAVLVVTAVFAYVLLGTSQRPSPAKVRVVTTALFDLHESFTTNGSRAVSPPGAWPASVRSLGANGVEVGATRASLSWGNGLWGFRWSKRFQLLRHNTNDSIWTLYQGYSFDGPTFRGLHWQRAVATITNVP